jgi:predicted ester cyclase
MTEQRLVIARRFMESYADGDTAGLLGVLAPDCLLHEADGSVTTRELIAEITDAHREPFPDKKVEYLQDLLDGDLVAHHVRFTLTHLGRYQHLEPTGKTVHLSEMIFHRMPEDLIAESSRMTHPDSVYGGLTTTDE